MALETERERKSESDLCKRISRRTFMRIIYWGGHRNRAVVAFRYIYRAVHPQSGRL